MSRKLHCPDPAQHEHQTIANQKFLLYEWSSVAPLSRTLMPAAARPKPKITPEIGNSSDRPAPKYPIGPTIVERIQRIRIQRGNFFVRQKPTASKSRPAANVSAPTG